MFRLLSLISLFAILGSGCAAQASVARAGGYSVEVVDAYGHALPTYQHRGQTYVLGNHNTRYQVRVHNHSGQRVEAVVTVDGRDVVSGDVGDYKHQRGYIVPPYGQVTIEGFRKNLSNVATFRFTTPGDSYSARRGTPQHVGVVGVAVFREKQRPVVRQPIRRPQRDFWGYKGGAAGGDLDDAVAEHAPASPSATRGDAPVEAEARGKASADEYAPRRRRSKNNLGTRYGETRHSAVEEVPFERRHASAPDQLLAIYYDNARGLQARGIQVYPAYGAAEPSPFPGNRFAPPPP